jgi:Recombination endonuclease VII
MVDGHRSDCIPCNVAAKRARTALDPEANRARARRWKRENPDRARAKQREYIASGRKQIWDRQSHLKRKYGITIADYDRMFEAQNGVCAICGQPRPEERTLHVDHDHETGVIRGLLCFRCNNALGDFREEYELFQRAANYLDRDDELAALVRERVGALTG